MKFGDKLEFGRAVKDWIFWDRDLVFVLRDIVFWTALGRYLVFWYLGQDQDVGWNVHLYVTFLLSLELHMDVTISAITMSDNKTSPGKKSLLNSYFQHIAQQRKS